MMKKVQGLDWDDGNREKCTKHGLSIECIQAFFEGNVQILSDAKHSMVEERYIAVGRASNNKPMIVGFTFRERNGQLFIRPITARYMHWKEAKKYEKAITQI